jgi:hypothetical protein
MASENTQMVRGQYKLPSVAELYGDSELVIKNTALAVLLNANPKEDWVRINPISNTKYIPIEIIEYLLVRIFGKYRREILNTMLIGNSVVVTVRLYVLDPITKEWDWHDGIGSAPLQTDKGKSPVDWNYLKNTAVMMAAPAAASFAMKDAAENFGKIFGKDLNRKDAQVYEGLLEVLDRRFKSKVEERIASLIMDSKTLFELENIRKAAEKENIQFTEELAILYDEKKSILKREAERDS